MKKFTSISRFEAIEIYPHIIKNYERLKKTADFAYTDANYGTALSLYILSSEELISGSKKTNHFQENIPFSYEIANLMVFFGL